MALVKKRSNTTRLFIVAVVILAVAGIGYFLFQQFFIKAPDQVTNTGVVPGQHGVITDFGEKILKDTRYTELKSFGTNINANANDNPGQPNPFQ